MFPIVLDPKALRVGLAGRGEGLERRLNLLADAGVTPAKVFADRLPKDEDLATLNLLLIADYSEDEARVLANQARRHGVLVNVEDRPAFCDFHVPAQIRRGDLLLTVSTAGRSPGLARAVREDLERRFGPEWDERIDEIAQLRASWRSHGLKAQDVAERTRAFLEEKGWLS